MRFKLLGRSGLRVSELCLGTMTFGEEWGFGAGKDECRQVFDLFVEAGGNFIDTANKYTEGTSERWVGEFIARDRERFVVATKYTLSMAPDDPNASGNHRKNLMRSVGESLERLGADYIDLLWVHAWDFMTPVEEVMRGLDDLVRAGQVRYVGVSDTPAWIVSQANTLAALMGWTPFVGLQIEYSLIQRTVERDLLPMARAFDIAVTPWGVVGGGVLTGKYAGQGDQVTATDSKRIEPNRWRITDRAMAIAGEVRKVAAETGMSASQVAINWVRQQPGVIIPILGARTAAQISDNLACLDSALSDDQLGRLSAVSRVDMGFPMDFLNMDFIRENVHGKTHARVDNHRKS